MYQSARSRLDCLKTGRRGFSEMDCGENDQHLGELTVLLLIGCRGNADTTRVIRSSERSGDLFTPCYPGISMKRDSLSGCTYQETMAGVITNLFWKFFFLRE